MAKVEASLRLRQAIITNDLLLVRRLLNNHPECLQNPDFEDKSNTSLHLAARLGLEGIAKYLIDLGHDRTSAATNHSYDVDSIHTGISINTDGQAPIHLAAAHSQSPLVELLCSNFPETVNRADKRRQTPLHLAASAHLTAEPKMMLGPSPRAAPRSSDDATAVEILLVHGADVNAQDAVGNTSLHNATAWGNLKAMRALISAGADPQCNNYAGWSPQSYSVTVQAEVYYKNLVAEQQKNQKTVSDTSTVTERRFKGGGGAVRLVSAGDDEESEDASSNRSRADSGRSNITSESGSATGSGLGIAVTAGRLNSYK